MPVSVYLFMRGRPCFVVVLHGTLETVFPRRATSCPLISSQTPEAPPKRKWELPQSMHALQYFLCGASRVNMLERAMPCCWCIIHVVQAICVRARVNVKHTHTNTHNGGGGRGGDGIGDSGVEGDEGGKEKKTVGPHRPPEGLGVLKRPGKI